MSFTICLVVVTLMCLMAWLAANYFESKFKETISIQQSTLVSSMATEIDNKLDTVHRTLIEQTLLVTPEIATNSGKAQAFLDQQLGLQSIFDNHIFLFTPEGKILAESPYVPDRHSLDFSSREYIQKTLSTAKPYISAPYVSSQEHHHPSIMCTVPLLDKDGKVVVIMAGGLDLMKDNFLGKLSETHIGQTGYLYIYNTDRTIIMHPDRNRILQQDVPYGVNKLFDNAASDNFEGTADTINSRGLPVLATFYRIHLTDWILAANYPTAEAYGPLERAKQYFLIAVLASITVLLVCINFTVRYLTTPLLRFTRHVEQISLKEGCDRFIDIHSVDEIGALSQAFNNMVVELDKKADLLEQSEQLYRTVVDFASDLAFWHNPEGKMLYISPNCERITGYSDLEFYNDSKLLGQIIHPDDCSIWHNLAYNSWRSGRLDEVIKLRIITKSGEVRWVNHIGRYVFDKKGEFMGLRGSLSDITERQQAENRLLYFSMHDSLTSLYNRAKFEATVKQFSSREYAPVGMMICDIDGLKLINDTFGHDRGDALLIAASSTIQSAFRQQDIISRIGGDEFAVLLPNTPMSVLEKAAQRLKDLVNQYNQEHDYPLHLSISVGYAVSENGTGLNELFKEADNNMYREKLHASQSNRSDIVKALMNTMQARDFITEGHAERLQDLVASIATEIGLSTNKLDDLRLLAKFHDIGKVGIPDAILLKPGPLTAEEYLRMQSHSEIGRRIAQSVPDLLPIADLVLKHHEWWNGTGYPLGLSGDGIPLECRILAIVDAYDAMTNDRPYRVAMPHEKAINEIQQCAGTQFDPSLVAVFHRITKARQQAATTLEQGKSASL